LFKHILKLRKEENLTIILVSHEGQDVLGLSDVIYFLNKGKLSSKKTPFNAYYQLDHLKNALLLGIVNQLSINDEKIRFRPDEYEVSDQTGIALEFESSLFLGYYYLNYFLGPRNETVILSSTTPFYKNFKIKILNKYQKKNI